MSDDDQRRLGADGGDGDGFDGKRGQVDAENLTLAADEERVVLLKELEAGSAVGV